MASRSRGASTADGLQQGTRSLVRRLTAVLLTGFMVIPSQVWAGGYVFNGETRPDVITHPAGYTGIQTTLTVEVCIDPASLEPGTSVRADQVTPVRNTIAIWNQLQPIQGNLISGSANNIAPTEIDFESVALHEIGHCIGLSHVNLASESNLSEPDRNFTKSTDGVIGGPPPLGNNPANYDLDAGTDGVRGSSDDVRGDDVNMHWFRKDTNDPGELPLPVPVDSTTYDRLLTELPAGHNFAANLDRTLAASLLGYPNTEAVMQQGSFCDEDQRRLTAAGVATVLLAASGADEIADTPDDYVLNLVYGGIKASCDLNLAITSTTGLAFCSAGGLPISSPSSNPHFRITSASMEFGDGFNWFFNQEGPCRQTELPSKGV